MAEAPKSPEPKKPRSQTVSAVPSSGRAKSKPKAAAAAAKATMAEPEAKMESKTGMVVLENETMPDAELASLELRQGAIGRLSASEVTVSQGAIGGARAEHVSVSQGAIGGALADTVSVSQGAAGTVIAREARIEQSVVGRLIAQDVRFERPSAVVFMLAQRVSGDIKVLFDWKAALALGGAFGVVAGVLRRISRRNG
jgi:hypothetical protein